MTVPMPAHNAREASPQRRAFCMEGVLETVRREVQKEVADSAYVSLELLRSRMSADLQLAREGLREQLRENLATDFAAVRDALQETLRELLTEEIRVGRVWFRHQLAGEVREVRKLLSDELQDAIRDSAAFRSICAAQHLSKRPPGEGAAIITSHQIELTSLDASLRAECTARDTAIRELRTDILERSRSTNERQDERHENLILGLQKTLDAAIEQLDSDLNAKHAAAIETALRHQLGASDFQSKIRSGLFFDQEQRFEEIETALSQGLMKELAKHLEDEHEARVNSIAEIRAEIRAEITVPVIDQKMRNGMPWPSLAAALQGESGCT